MLLEISGEITPERMKGWSQSKNNTQLCRPAPPGFAPALLGSRRVPSHIGDPREHNRDRPPTHSERNLDLCSPGLPQPGCAPGAFPAAVAISESTTGSR